MLVGGVSNVKILLFNLFILDEPKIRLIICIVILNECDYFHF